MRTMLMPLAVGLNLLVLASPAWAETALSGWDKLNFAMSPDQVRAVKGMVWDELVKIHVPGGLSTMDSKKPVAAFGAKYTARLIFDGALKLTTIDLVSNQEMSAPACDALTRKVLASAETTYGPFAPDPRLTDVPGLTFETAGAQSRLLIQTSVSDDMGKTVIGETRHAVGPVSIQVSMNMREPIPTGIGAKQAHFCETHVIFNAQPRP